MGLAAMNRCVYIVSTYYHALVSSAKQIVSRRDADIIVTGYIPDGESLSLRLDNSGLFTRTYYIRSVVEYQARSRLDYYFNQHRKNSRLVSGQLPVVLKSYDEIYIYHDDTWVARYLKDSRIKYHLIEDALNSLESIGASNFSYMLINSRLKCRLKRMFHIGYLYCGTDRNTLTVEVNDARGVHIPNMCAQLVELPRERLFSSLSDGDVELLEKIFPVSVGQIPENSVLLLTQALKEYNVVSGDSQQLRIYRALADRFVGKGETLVIKPHPRDTADYSAEFPDAVVLDKNMPVEMLELKRQVHFRTAFALDFSTVSRLKCADSMTIVSREFINEVNYGKVP